MQPVAPRPLCGRKHAIFPFLAREFFPARTRTRAGARARGRARLFFVRHISREEIMNPISRALAHYISVVRWRNEADGLGGAGI